MATLSEVFHVDTKRKDNFSRYNVFPVFEIASYPLWRTSVTPLADKAAVLSSVSIFIRSADKGNCDAAHIPRLRGSHGVESHAGWRSSNPSWNSPFSYGRREKPESAREKERERKRKRWGEKESEKESIGQLTRRVEPSPSLRAKDKHHLDQFNLDTPSPMIR